jgi:hypothetical protein
MISLDDRLITASERCQVNEVSIVKTEFVVLDVHPFVKWAGGKSQLLSELDKMIPSQFNTSWWWCNVFTFIVERRRA